MKRILYALVAIALTANLPLSAQPPQGQNGQGQGQGQQTPASPPAAQQKPGAPGGGGGTGGQGQGQGQQTPASPSAAQQKPGAPGGGGGTGGPGGAGGAGSAAAVQKPKAFPFGIYVDQGSRDNHYIPSGWMGDYGDLKINPGCTEGPHSGKNCMKITYSAKMTQGAGWAGIFWQQPANNWGDKRGGYNLTGAKRLTFWARGAKGGEKIAEFKFGGITGEYPDTDSASIGPLELTNQWKQYTIDLNGKDLSDIIGAFAWAASKDDNPDGFMIYLDDIVYE